MRVANVEALWEDAQILESTRYADRYSTGQEDSQWFCSWCESAMDDESEPCPQCGNGKPT